MGKVYKELDYKLHFGDGHIESLKIRGTEMVITMICPDKSVYTKLEYTGLKGEPRECILSKSLYNYKMALSGVYFGLYTKLPKEVGIERVELKLKNGNTTYYIDTNELKNKDNLKIRSGLKVIDTDVQGVDYYYFVKRNFENRHLEKESETKEILAKMQMNDEAYRLYNEIMIKLSKYDFQNFKIRRDGGIFKLYKTTDNSEFKLNDNDLSFLTDAEFALLFTVFCYAIARDRNNTVVQFLNMGLFESLVVYSEDIEAEIKAIKKKKQNELETIEEDLKKGVKKQENLKKLEKKGEIFKVTQINDIENNVSNCLDYLIDYMAKDGAIVHLYNIPDSYKGKYRNLEAKKDLDSLDDDDDIIAESKDVNVQGKHTNWYLRVLK